MAAFGNQTKMSKFLVTRGADANAKNKGGVTAMMGRPRTATRSSSDTCTRTAPRSTRRTTTG